MESLWRLGIHRSLLRIREQEVRVAAGNARVNEVILSQCGRRSSTKLWVKSLRVETSASMPAGSESRNERESRFGHLGFTHVQ